MEFMKKLSVLTLLLVVGCAHNRTITKEDLGSYFTNEKMENIDIFPGSVGLLKFQLPSDFENAVLFCDGEKIPSTVENNSTLVAVLAESYFSKRKGYNCDVDFRWNKGKYRFKIAKVNVLKKKFPMEKLNVNKKKVFLTKKDKKRVAREWTMLTKVYSHSSMGRLFDENFSKPLNSFVTSHYGKKRIFNNHKKTQHLGIDFRAAVGKEIPSANRGKVIFIGNLFYSGNTVIVDHGLGIFTMYGHLSKILVRKDEEVDKNTIVGLAGMTGRVSGPHLHWGVKVHGNWVDGMSLVEQRFLQ